MTKAKEIPGYGRTIPTRVGQGIQVDGEFFSKKKLQNLTTGFSRELKEAAKTPEQMDDLRVARRYASSEHLNEYFDPTYRRPGSLEPVSYLGKLLQLDVKGNKLGQEDVVTIEDMANVTSIRWNTNTVYHFEGSTVESSAVVTGIVTTKGGKTLQVAALLANENGELRFTGTVG